ncbi:serine/arginine repetitive matrix protein 1-like [Ctenocephalides felis]|uniref:serine/arginine repetitive matrix protein 1-like n=1 Tax=Ctenocephalides felis TaxID=7515 RepID=UPI000E6E11E6|nr:serine/arginine repetitive matrix protein 1-like [Ctenocephalides felis]
MESFARRWAKPVSLKLSVIAYFLKETKIEHTEELRPISQLDYMHSPKKEVHIEKHAVVETSTPADAWYKEVLELRKKAGEYKSRGWGTELSIDQVADISNKQIELWEQVSRRSSLSALSLASTSHRSITKEEKDKENNKKTSPTKAAFIKTPRMLDNARFRKETIRHHLERTTGIDCSEEGALLPSPTLEKLVPVTPRSEEHYSPKRCSPQKGSPQKSSPKKGSPQKSSPQKSKSSPRSGRSHSVGPGVIQSENLSPKRTPRPGSTVTATTASAAAKQKKSPTMAVSAERRPRPTSLSTTVPSRSKSSSVPPKPHSSSSTVVNRNAEAQQQSRTKTPSSAKQAPTPTPKSAPAAGPVATGPVSTKIGEDKTPKLEIEDDGSVERDAASVSSSAGSALTPREQIVKSPPEPTRVKSPEQIIMRSPDPVNWTVPLDTGKTFTVTQNVREGGDAVSTPTPRPQSEIKARSPRDLPPSAPQSATSSHRDELVNGNSTDNRGDTAPVTAKPDAVESVVSPGTGRSLASEVLEKARTRFDKFWGKDSKDDDV